MSDLFDGSKPHFAAWLQIHDIDENWDTFSSYSRDCFGSPLYYAAFCGFYDVAELLITKQPEQVNARGGRNLFPLQAALYKGHLHVANLLHRHGAVVDVQGQGAYTPLHAASFHGQVDIMRWLLDHGADANARGDYQFTPLSEAACRLHLEAVDVLLQSNADIDLQYSNGYTTLYWVLSHCSSYKKFVDMVRRLLERGADPNICDDSRRTPLHEASSLGLLEAVQLLLSYGAKADEKDEEGNTPFQLAASEGHGEVTKLLLEHGVVPPPSQP